MMSYRYDKRKRKQKRFIFVIGLVILLLVFTPALSYLYDIFERPFSRAYHNAQRTGGEIELIFDTSRFSKRALVDHNQVLQKEILRLQAEKKYSDFFIHQNQNSLGAEFSYAQVLDRKTFKNSHLLIDKGSKDGLQIGDLVFADEYVLIGEVIEVFDTTSRFKFYTANDHIHDGILFPHDISVQLKGRGNFYEIELDRFVEVMADDVIYAAGVPGFVMGLVRDIEFDSRNAFKRVIVSPAFNIHELTHVYIQKNYDNS